MCIFWAVFEIYLTFQWSFCVLLPVSHKEYDCVLVCLIPVVKQVSPLIFFCKIDCYLWIFIPSCKIGASLYSLALGNYSSLITYLYLFPLQIKWNFCPKCRLILGYWNVYKIRMSHLSTWNVSPFVQFSL